MKNETIINRLRLDDEILSAIMSGHGYKSLKLCNRTLSKLRDGYQSCLDDCEMQLNEYKYKGGQIVVDIDNTLVYAYNGIELTISNDTPFDRETLGELLIVVLSTFMRYTYADAVALLDQTIDENTEKVSLNGISDLTKSILEDPRFASTLIDGVDLESNEDIPALEDEEDEEEVLE